MMPAVAQHKDENPMNRSTLHNDLIDNAIFSGDSRRTQVQIDRHSICVYVCDELDS
jgi:hypothetical protein